MRIEEKNDQLQIVDFNEVEAYYIAGKIEKDGICFYTRLREQQSDAQARQALDWIIEQEQRHQVFFDECLTALNARSAVPLQENDILNSIDFGIFQPYQNMLMVESLPVDAKNSMRLALLVETRSIQFYNHCREQVTSEPVKEQLAVIIAEEEKHRQLLQQVLRGC